MSSVYKYKALTWHRLTWEIDLLIIFPICILVHMYVHVSYCIFFLFCIVSFFTFPALCLATLNSVVKWKCPFVLEEFFCTLCCLPQRHWTLLDNVSIIKVYVGTLNTPADGESGEVHNAFLEPYSKTVLQQNNNVPYSLFVVIIVSGNTETPN